MTISSVDVFSYALPLVRPLRLGNETHAVRNGFLLRLKTTDDTDDLTGWGEAAPLPSFSAESSEQVRSQLLNIPEWLTGLEIPNDAAQLCGALPTWLQNHELAASVQCAVEVAVLNLIADRQATPMARLLDDRALESVHINSLIMDDDNVTESVRQMQRDGYRAIKMKVGRLTVEEDVDRTRDAFRELGSSTTLRLDANRAWSFADACVFAEQIADCTIDYLEEPLADHTRLREFASLTGLPIALDESLLDLTPEQLGQFDFVKAVVLKPTLLGGFDRTAALARVAQSLNMKVVISSSFESSIGIAALTHLAAAIGSFNTPAGLDTLSWFEHDLLADPIDSSHQKLRIGQLARVSNQVKMTMLQEVSGG